MIPHLKKRTHIFYGFMCKFVVLNRPGPYTNLYIHCSNTTGVLEVSIFLNVSSATTALAGLEVWDVTNLYENWTDQSWWCFWHAVKRKGFQVEPILKYRGLNVCHRSPTSDNWCSAAEVEPRHTTVVTVAEFSRHHRWWLAQRGARWRHLLKRDGPTHNRI